VPDGADVDARLVDRDEAAADRPFASGQPGVGAAQHVEPVAWTPNEVQISDRRSPTHHRRGQPWSANRPGPSRRRARCSPSPELLAAQDRGRNRCFNSCDPWCNRSAEEVAALQPDPVGGPRAAVFDLEDHFLGRRPRHDRRTHRPGHIQPAARPSILSHSRRVSKWHRQSLAAIRPAARNSSVRCPPASRAASSRNAASSGVRAVNDVQFTSRNIIMTT